jgi:xanthine dehydrogenase YagT iron-sulfur-binding subunit
MAEIAAGQPGEATADLNAKVVLTDAEIRERMSGNLCRCSAYPQILAAVRRAAGAAA